MKHALLALALFACRDREHALTRDVPVKHAGSGSGSGAAAAAPAKPHHTLAALETTLPAGWTSEYDRDLDRWLFTLPAQGHERPAIHAHLAQLSAAIPPSAKDYLTLREQLWDKGTVAEIVEQQTLPDGFAMTVNVKPAVDPTHPKHETYVLRHAGDTWLDCQCEWVPDDAIRDQVLALCESAAP